MRYDPFPTVGGNPPNDRAPVDMLHCSMYVRGMSKHVTKIRTLRPMLCAAVLAACAAAAAPAVADDAPRAETIACVAEAVYFEARGTSDRSQAAVAHVVLNRSQDPQFPDTPCAVVDQGCQFSYNCDGKPETLAVREDRAKAIATAEKVVAGVVPDPTDGALFFHGRSVRPSWTSKLDRTAEIGGHIFYR